MRPFSRSQNAISAIIYLDDGRKEAKRTGLPLLYAVTKGHVAIVRTDEKASK